MAESKNGKEIAELLDQLREKTVADAAEKRKETEKKKKMTDDDVKNLLRKYFDDIDPPSNAEKEDIKAKPAVNIYDLDTSDFVSGEDSEKAPEENTEIGKAEEFEEIEADPANELPSKDLPEENLTDDAADIEESVEDVLDDAAEIEESDEDVTEDAEEADLELEDTSEDAPESDIEFDEDIEDDIPLTADDFEEYRDSGDSFAFDEEEPEATDKTEIEANENNGEEPEATEDIDIEIDEDNGEDLAELEELDAFEEEFFFYGSEESENFDSDDTIEDEIIYDYKPRTEMCEKAETAPTDEPFADEQQSVKEDTPGEKEESIFEWLTYIAPIAEIIDEETIDAEADGEIDRVEQLALDIAEDEDSEKAEDIEKMHEELIIDEISEEESNINYDNVNESDVDVMVALGFGDKIRDKFGDERIMRATKDIRKNKERVETDRPFGYIGEEYTSKEQKKDIEAAFENDKKTLHMRLIVTAVFAFALLIYENAPIFGITLGGIFSPTAYPTAHTLLSLQLLILCAFPSWKTLYEGALSVIRQKPTAKSVLAVSLAAVVVYDIMIAVIAPREGVRLFDFPIAVGILFCVLSEYLDLRREITAFSVIAEEGTHYVLSDVGDDPEGNLMLSADKTDFVGSYFERSAKLEKTPNILLFTVIPLFAAGIIASVVSAAMGLGASQSLGAFAAVISFGAPMSQIACISWVELSLAFSLHSFGAASVGRGIKDEYSDAAVLVIDDSAAFPSGSAEVHEMHIYDNNQISHTLYNLNALFTVAGGPLRKIFADAAQQLGEPESVELCEYGADYISIKVDGQALVEAGSKDAFELRGIAINGDGISNADSKILYLVVDGKLCARVVCKYRFDEKFLRALRILTRDKFAVRIRSLDPSINEILTFDLCPDASNLSVSKEKTHNSPLRTSDSAVVSSKEDMLDIVRPLVMRRKARHIIRALAAVGTALMAACAAFAVALVLSGLAVGLSAIAAICQILCFVPAVMAVVIAKKDNTDL